MAEKTYEYFRSEPIIINGKFARYTDALWVQNQIQNSKFTRLFDVYAAAVMVGLLTETRLEDDLIGDGRRTIQVDQLTHEYKRFTTLMQAVILVDQSRNLDVRTKAQMAFDSNPKTEQVYRENMELFHSYARGGLEQLYNRLVLRSLGYEDEFSDTKISNIIEFAKNPTARDVDFE